jgi:hypothetical protein
MNPDYRVLLDDLFAGDSTANFREASLAEMLQGVQRRRQRRRVQNVVATAAALALTTAGMWWLAPERPASPEVSRNVQPGRAGEVATTVATIRSQAGKVQVVVSDPASVVIVRTGDPAGRWREISDDELLGLFAGQGAALVRTDGHAFVVAAGRRVGESPEPVN